MPDGGLSEFAILTSKMHVGWIKTVDGRLKNDISYSPSVWFTFPIPEDADLSTLDPFAQAVLDARAAHPGSTLAQLYDPDLMPRDLRDAHRALDRAVDRLYRRRAFSGDRERVEHLFGLYERMAAPLDVKAKGKRRRRRAAS